MDRTAAQLARPLVNKEVQMPKIYGQIEEVSLENLSSDPSGNTEGRIWRNSTENRVKTDDGTNKRALLRNDDKAVIGNNGTANNNIRLHRGASGVLQFVTGGDSTSEGSLSTSLNQISAKQENYTSGTRPTAANAGRMIWETDTSLVKVDTGSTWKTVGPSPTTTKGDLMVHNGTLDIRLAVGTNGQYLKADSTQASGLVWGSGSANYAYRSVTTTDTCTNTDDVLMLSGASFTQNLFSAASNTGKVLTIKHNGTSLSQVYTIDGNGSETIGGATTYLLYTNGETLKIVSDGTNWQILDHTTSTDWASNTTMTITGTTSNPTKGTINTDYITWRRSGNMAEISFNYRQTAAGSAGSGNYQVAMPTNMTIDTTRIQTYTGTDATVAFGFRLNSSVTGNTNTTNGSMGGAYAYSSSLLCVNFDVGSGGFAIWGSSGVSLSNTTVNMIGWIRVPISGWNP